MSGAVFISYASQDAVAAQRLADALRASGVEVWFDQNELVGGDAWDTKIRGQIASCALFVPVISAATQARLEGYFRLEWKLASHRMQTMADEKVFLLPVVIDGTKDAEAKTPAEFKAVQWTRLPGGEGAEKFCARVRRILDGAAEQRPEVEDPGREVSQAPTVRRRGGGWAERWWLVFPVLGMVTGLVFALQFARSGDSRRKSESPPPPAEPIVVAPATKLTPAAATRSEARQLADRGFAMSVDKYDSTIDDFATADGLFRRALALDPTDGEILARAAQLNLMYRNRGFDFSPERIATGRQQAERAIRLAPESPESLLALSLAQRYTGNREGYLQSLQRAVALDPNHARGLLFLGATLIGRGQVDEGLALYARARQQPEWAPLADYLEYLRMFNTWRFAEADQLVRRSYAAKPSANSATGIAVMRLIWRGDLDEGARELAAVPSSLRDTPRLVWIAAMMHLCRRAPDEALRLLERVPEDFFQDSWATGPKALLVGRAHALAGHDSAARLAWEAGLPVVEAKIKAEPGNADYHNCRGELLAWLGRAEEALAEARTVAELNRGPAQVWTMSEAKIYAILGRADLAIPALDTLIKSDSFWPVTPMLLQGDPLWDRIRGDARFGGLSDKAAAMILAANPAPDWPKDADLKRAVKLLNSPDAIAADVALAEDIAKTVLAARPTDLEATIVMGQIHVYYLLRGFDRSEERFAEAKRFADRALALAPTNPAALTVMATYLYRRGVELPRAAKLLRAAIELRPAEPMPYRILDNLLSIMPGVTDTEIIASAKITAERFPSDALVQYELARHYRDAGMLAEAEHYLDIAIKLGPVANALIARARLLLFIHGDPAGMKKLLDQLPDRYVATDRAVFSQFGYALATGQPQLGLDALRATPEPWMIDFDYTGPTALLAGELLLQQGKPELARLKFTDALAELGRHKPDLSRNFSTTWLESWLLMRLGRRDEARARNAVFFPELNRPFRLYLGTNWWFNPITHNLLLGERAKALELMREGVGFQEGRTVLRNAFRLDPRMAPFRDAPEIQALLIEPAAK